MVMEYVEIIEQGSAVLPAKSTEDEIQYNDQGLRLPRLRGWQSPSRELPDVVRRVQKLGWGVRRSMFDDFRCLQWQHQIPRLLTMKFS